MPEVLSDHVWAKRRRGQGRKPIYDWATLFDGRVRRLVQGEDFSLPTSNFIQLVRSRARKNQVLVQIQAELDSDGRPIPGQVILQKTGERTNG